MEWIFILISATRKLFGEAIGIYLSSYKCHAKTRAFSQFWVISRDVLCAETIRVEKWRRQRPPDLLTKPSLLHVYFCRHAARQAAIGKRKALGKFQKHAGK